MSVQNHMAIKQIVAEIFQPGPYVVFWPTDTAIPRAMLLAIYLTYNATKIFLNVKIVHLSSWSGIFLQKIPSLYAWLKDQGSSFPTIWWISIWLRVQDELPCLSKFSTGPLRRLEQVEVTGALACTHGTDGWTPWPKPRTYSYRSDNDIPTSEHTPLKMSLYCFKLMVKNLRHTMLQAQAENNRFPWQTLKPLIKTLQHRHMKTSNHASIFWDVQRVIWDQLLWAHSLQSSPLSLL